jgi:8-oxo-dGTP diphosphatase
MEPMTDSNGPTNQHAPTPQQPGPHDQHVGHGESAEHDAPAPAQRVVVAAVIEREGLFLAARRIGPPALAGRWEFPGGKTEPGEDDAAALRRECLEELGVRIAVGEPVGPAYTAAGGSLLVRTYRATLVDGEPAPIEGHDELRWLAAGAPGVRELPWLDGDYLILDALEASAQAGTRVA